jgi:asparagine synthetase B (glutamine-hydrolysing)
LSILLPPRVEGVHARRVAGHLGTHHVERRFDEAQLMDSLEPALSSLDEPIGDPSVLPTYLLSCVAADHVKVVLPKKGFAIPLARWLIGPLRPRMTTLLAQSPLWDLGLLRQETVARWLDEHCRRRSDHSKPLWSLLVLDHWYRRVLCRSAA